MSKTAGKSVAGYVKDRSTRKQDSKPRPEKADRTDTKQRRGLPTFRLKDPSGAALKGGFSASFGPFRRFTGGDREMDRLYLTYPRLAPHLSAFGENVALGESLRWLTNLQIKKLEGDKQAGRIKNAVISFVNDAELLPYSARITGVTSEQVEIQDGHGARVAVEEMSDGYRSILSMTFELMRLMFTAFNAETALNAINSDVGTVTLPGVVAIDEIDAHLHPAWQQRIGDWFIERFPETQFFVTTHSPIICRAARHGSVWLLPKPNSEERPRRIVENDLSRLIDGNILDAYGTDLFGEEVTRSEQSKENLERLARLNRKRLSTPLPPADQRDLEQLRAAMPSNQSSHGHHLEHAGASRGLRGRCRTANASRRQPPIDHGMLPLRDPGLDVETARRLRGYQSEVDAAANYAEQVDAGKRLFGRYSSSTNLVFKVVREQLAVMCSGARRCGYCEDSVGDEIEHIKPKDLYPERTFIWENYLLACGQCNRGKSSRFSVTSGGRLVEVTRRRGEPVLPPRMGPPALIVPRDEDPLVFLDLEIVDTFIFLPRENLQGIDEARADYTIDVLKLNREVLRVARSEAYGAYRARLVEYRELRDDGASEASLRTLRDAIRSSAHPTVWSEMRRQHAAIDELQALYQDVPEALDWV